MQKINKQRLSIFLTLIVISFLVTIPYFLGTRGVAWINSKQDWVIHFGRMKDLYDAFAEGKLPSQLSYIGFSGKGIAMNAMYPFITLFAFIWPTFLPISFNHAIILVFWLFNFFLVTNIYFLARELTNKLYVQLIAVCLYAFNTWHLIVFYERFSVGEIIGYSTIPLVLLGMIKIWRHEKIGVIILAFAMSFIINSHNLSTFIIVSGLILAELIRLIMKKIDWEEIKSLLIAVGITLVTSLFSLMNFWQVGAHNGLVVPSLNPDMDKISTKNNFIVNEIQSMFQFKNLQTHYKFQDFNIGIILIILSIVAILYLIIHRNRKNGFYLFSAVVGVIGCISTTQIFPWTLIVQKIPTLNILQYACRLMSYSVIFLVIAIIGWLDDDEQFKISYPFVGILTAFLMVMSMGSIYKTSHWYATVDGVHVTRNKPINFNTADYYPQSSTIKVEADTDFWPALMHDTDKNIRFSKVMDRSDGVTYRVRSKSGAKRVNKIITPAIRYKTEVYKVKVNGHNVPFTTYERYRTIQINKKFEVNKIKSIDISFINPNYFAPLFLLTFIMFIGMAVILIRYI